MTRDHLYPHIEPYGSGTLSLDDTHNMYWEQSGNPNGIPVVFLHGGPGAGSIPAHRRFFDPGKYRIVIFDQRGAGRSCETQGYWRPAEAFALRARDQAAPKNQTTTVG